MRYFRRILGISYTEHVTKEEGHTTITKHVKHYEKLIITVKKRKLRWCGYVTRASGRPKTILLDTIQGGKRRGRQRKKWIDNIAEWIGKSFASTQTPTHDRQSRKQLVQHPQDPGKG